MRTLSHAARFWPSIRAAAVLLAVVGSGCQGSSEAATPPTKVTSTPGQEVSPSLSPDGSALAFAMLTGPGNSDIYVSRAGGAPENLTADTPLNDTEPAFSADGQQIAFRSGREGGGIFVMPAAGGAARKVIDEGFNPVFTPDGTEIVYGSASAVQSPYGANVSSVIWAVNVQSGAKRQVSPGYGIGPTVSPNGQRVAYWSLGDGTTGTDRDIWTVKLDGTDNKRVTNDAAVDWSPVWAPDGERLYFASDRDGAMKIWVMNVDQTSGNPSGDPELVSSDQGAQIRGHLSFNTAGELTYIDATISRSVYSVALDGNGVMQGTATQIQDPSVAAVDIASSWDGSMVAFRSGDNHQEDIYVVSADGTQRKQLTNDVFRDRVPAWSPDGTKIAWRSTRPSDPNSETPAEYYQLWTMNADGTRPRQVTNTAEGPASAATWSPDGTMIAWSMTPRTGGAIMYLMNQDGSGARILARSDTGFDGFVFSPDSRRVVYHPTRGESAFILDITRPGAEPTPLPNRVFAPVSWSKDGALIIGSEIRPGQPNRPVMYAVPDRRFEATVEVGAGATWLTETKFAVNRDGATKIQVVDERTKNVTDLISVTPPSALAYDFSRDGKRFYYVESEFEADVYRMKP